MYVCVVRVEGGGGSGDGGSSDGRSVNGEGGDRGNGDDNYYVRSQNATVTVLTCELAPIITIPSL